MAGPQLDGKISIFGTDPSLGIHDSSDSGSTASGIPESAPGIAVYNHQTLGGYWLVRGPNGRQAILRQSDIGPAPWTGRVVDFTPKGGQALGLNPHNFPTDSRAKLTFLGHDLAQAQARAKGVQFAGNIPGGGGMGSPGTPSKTVGTFDQAGFQQAQQDQTLAGMVSSAFGKDNALLSTGALSTAPVDAGQFAGSKTIPGTPARPAGQIAQALGRPGQYVNPLSDAHVTAERVDMGKDFAGTGHYKAIGNGVVTYIGSWGKYGPYMQYKLTDGPRAGQYVYVAEGITPLVKVGQRVGAGQNIARFIPGYQYGTETGFGGANNNALASGHYSEGQKTKEGLDFARFLRSLGGPSGND